MPPRTSKKQKASSSKETSKTSAPQTPRRKSRNLDDTQFTPSGTPSQSLSESLFSLSASQAQLSQFLDEGEEISDVLSGAYISESMSSGELSERMKKVADILKGIGQLATPEDAPWDELFLVSLIDKKILTNRTEDVKVYAARAIVDILRVTAPECPFEEEELPRIFKFLIAQIEALKQGTGSLFSQRFYLLERLSTVKIFIMLFEAPDCDNLIIELFESLLRIVTDCESKQPQKIISYICDIMISILESSESIESKLIEILIQPLLENKSKISVDDEDEDNEENEEETLFSAKHIVRTVMDKTQEHISTALNDYLNDSLKQLEKTKDKTTSSYKKKRGRVFSLIYEINLISSRLLLTVIPNICMQLKDEDVDIRSVVIILLGSMFKAKESILYKEYPNIFETDFLSRFNDKDSRIRVCMSKFASGMIKNHPSSSKILNEKLSERMMDPDEKVRRNVVETVVSVAMESPALISEDLMQKLQERSRDKKAVLRLHTLELCAKLYKHHATEALKNSDSWQNDTSEKLSWIPNTIIKYYAEQHENVVSHRIFIERLIDEDLLDQASLRTKTLLDIFSKLDDRAKQVFDIILTNKKTYQNAINNLLHQDYENTDNLSTVMSTLISLLPDESVGKRIWKEIYSRRSKQSEDVIKTLKSCLNINSSQKEVSKLKKKSDDNLVGSKKEEKDYMRDVIQRSAMTIFTKEQVGELVELAQKLSTSEQYEMTLSSIHLVNQIVKLYPTLGKDSIPNLIELMEKEQDYELNIACLKVLGFSAEGLEKSKFSLASDLEEKLINFCTKGKPKEVKRASEVISKAFITPFNVLNKVLKHAKDNLEYNESLVTSLAALRQVVNYETELFRNDEEEIVEFALNQVLLIDREEKSSGWSSLSLETESKIEALKLLVDYCIASAKEGVTTESESTSSKLVDLLFDLLQYNGSIKAILEKDEKSQDKMDTTEESSEEKKDDKKTEIDRAALRLSAFKCIIKLTTSNDFKMNLTVARFLQIAFIAVDSSVEVKKNVVDLLFKHLLKTQIGTRFAAILLLFVGDKNAELALRAKKYFSKLVPFYRNLISKTKGLTLTSQKACEIYPEYILPYLIFLLSHFPTFNKEIPHLVTFQKVLFAYFDEVTHETDNLSFFHHLITKIKQKKDGIKPKSQNHLIICDLSVAIVNRCAESSGIMNSTLPFPGKVYIPALFKNATSADEEEDNMTSVETIKTVFLPSAFKLNEKLARQIQPEKQKKPRTLAASDNTDPSKKRKRNTTKSGGTKKKKESETAEPRKLPSRSAKQNRKKIESESEKEESEEEESEEEQSEQEASESEHDSDESEKPAPRTQKKKQTKSKAKEPEQSVSSKKKKFK